MKLELDSTILECSGMAVEFLIICIPTCCFSAVSDPVFGELYHRLYVFLPPGGPFLSFFESAFRSLQYYFFPRVLWKYILYLKKKKLTIEKFPFKNDEIFGVSI